MKISDENMKSRQHESTKAYIIGLPSYTVIPVILSWFNYVKMILYLGATSMQAFYMLFSSLQLMHPVLHLKLHNDISSAKSFFSLFSRDLLTCE